MLGTPDIASVVGVQIVEELEAIAATVEDIDQTQPLGQPFQSLLFAHIRDHLARSLSTVRPEQGFAIFTFAALGRSLALGSIGSVVKLLSEQAKDTPGVGDHDQAVMALETSPSAVADLAELIVQRGEGGVAQFGKVMQA